ncbi:MAG: S8 family serine peptidase [Peptococcaceae bacterium]|nr:S8 family serine peptidase [Peptococcaceae bacterium]
MQKKFAAVIALALAGSLLLQLSVAAAMPAQVHTNKGLKTELNKIQSVKVTTLPDSTLNTHVVVQLQAGISPDQIAQALGASVLRRGPLNFATLEFGTAVDAVTLRKARQIKGVVSAEISRAYQVNALPQATVQKMAASDVPEVTIDGQWSLTKAHVPQAWQMGATGSGVTIAIVDTGVDLTDPDLIDNLVPGYNAITGESGPAAAQDDNGHGTNVAGIAAAELNGLGVVGVAYNASIMPVKVMDSSGQGTDDVIAAGIVWAADNGAQIINLSLGAGGKTDVLTQAVEYAENKGCLIVAATGNFDPTSASNPGVDYPAADPNVIAVTASTDNDTVANFSCTGPQTDLTAPGVGIVSDYWQNGTATLATSDGTSMAAPFVSGVAALLWSEQPDLTARQIRIDLEDSAVHIGDAGRNYSAGFGRVDAYSALQYASTPATLQAPADVVPAGGIVQTAGKEAALLIPPGTFTTQVSVSLTTATSAADLPADIIPGGPAVAIAWQGSLGPPGKMLLLGLSAQTSDLGGGLPGYIYRWDGGRWILVGGGASGSNITAGIYTPGTYRLGYPPRLQQDRLFGADRIQTAIQIAQAAFPTGADTVILARDNAFPDALAGAPLAYKDNAPILLTDSNTLPTAVLAEIQTLAPQHIIVLGGPGAISDAIYTELSLVAPTDRIGGSDRYHTAADIAANLGTTGKAVVVNGQNFPDALSIAPQAAQAGEPILLTPAGDLSGAADQALRQLGVSDTLAVGGEGVLSGLTLDGTVNPYRLAGNDRYATAAVVAQTFPPVGEQVYVATGEDFPDALTGGVLAATRGTDVLLVPSSGLPPELNKVVQNWHGVRATAFGGDSVVPQPELTALQALFN